MTNVRINQIITEQLTDALYDVAMEWAGDEMNQFNATTEEICRNINADNIMWEWRSEEQDNWEVIVSCPDLGIYEIGMEVSVNIEVRGKEE